MTRGLPTPPPSAADLPSAHDIRRRIVTLSHAARSAHLGSSLSCVEILNCIVGCSDIRPDTVRRPDRDRLLLSKGHAAMAYYAVMAAHGLIDPARLEVYLQDDSVLWGHVTRTEDEPVIDASTGSLGHGLGLGAGFALGYRLRHRAGRIFVVLSDGELDEGSTWEAALFAGHHGLDALCAVVDYNRIQSLAAVSDVMELEPLADKWRAFRWDVLTVDGHDQDALIAALSTPSTTPSGGPRVIIATTTKGKGLPHVENTVASHYHPARASDVALFGG